MPWRLMGAHGALMLRTILASAMIIALSACASAPEMIDARPANGATFSALSCTQLEARRSDVDASLAAAEAAQRRTRRVDTVGVALVFLPVGSLIGGNRAREIGELKGQREALQGQFARAQCWGDSVADAPISTHSSSQ